MNKHLLVFLCLTLWTSCVKNIKWENVKNKNGCYVDSSSGEILDGKYKSETPSNNMSRENVIIFEYSNGIPVGEWTDTHDDELIHIGKYLGEENTKSNIQRLTKCKRVDLDFWKEADYPYLTIELIEPIITDPLTLKKVVEYTQSSLLNKYKFREIRIDSIGATGKNYIYEYNIK